MPMLLMYMCPFRGCQVRRKGQKDIFGHMLKQWHVGHGLAFDGKMEQLRGLLADMPYLCQLVKNQRFVAPDLDK